MNKIIAAAVSAALTASVLPIPAFAIDEYCVYEAESAYTGGWAVRIDDSSASAGALVTHVGGTNTDIGTVVFNVWADSTGTYDCTVSYRSREDSSFYIRVNYDGWDPANDTKVSTSASDSITDTKQGIKLNKGWNKVKIYSLEGIEKSNGKIAKDKRIDIDKLPFCPFHFNSFLSSIFPSFFFLFLISFCSFISCHILFISSGSH